MKIQTKNPLAEVKGWIKSYLLVLMVSMAICSLFYLYAYLVVSEKTSEANEVALGIIASELNNTFEKVVEIEYGILSSESISACERIKLPLDTPKRIQLIQASNDLSEHLIWFSDVVTECQVYYPDNGMVLLGSGNYTDLKGGYERLGQRLGYSWEEWENLIVQHHDRAVFTGTEEDTILYLTTLPKYGDSIKKNVALIINTRHIQRILDEMSGVQQGSLCLISDNEKLLVSGSNIKLDIAELLGQLPVESGYHRININEMDSMIAYEKLANVNVLLVSIIPYREYWSAALKSLSAFWGALGLCFVVGVFVSYFVASRKQRIWGRLDVVLNSKIGGDASDGLSKDKVIAEALDSIVEEYHYMQSQISSVETMKREVLLTAILRGRIRAEEADRVLAKNNVKFEIGNYMIVLFQIDRLNQFYDMDSESIDAAQIGHIHQSILLVLQGFSKIHCTYETLNFDEKVVCIVDFRDLDKEDCYRWIEKIAEECSEEVRKGVGFTISISDVHRHVYSLFHAYSEALSVMEYQIRNVDKQILYYREMVQKSQATYLYSLEEEKALIYWIQVGKESEALKLFEEICENNMCNVSHYEDFSRCLIWNLSATILRVEAEAGNNIDFSTAKEFLQNMKEIDNVFDAKKFLKEKIVEICSNIKAKKKSQDNLEERIKKYIEKRYSECSLSVRDIANYFDMNANYISGFFKEKTGMALLSYIQKVRLDKVKELLVTTDMTLEKIGEQTGFNNNVSFIRTFKKYEKITPTEYRKRERKL